jgi:hypothetical protein
VKNWYPHQRKNRHLKKNWRSPLILDHPKTPDHKEKEKEKENQIERKPGNCRWKECEPVRGWLFRVAPSPLRAAWLVIWSALFPALVSRFVSYLFLVLFLFLVLILGHLLKNDLQLLLPLNY